MLLRLIIVLISVCSVVLPSAARELTVTSFNIRYANPADGQYAWNARARAACHAINMIRPDILGTQEVLHEQLLDMKSMLPSYAVVGVGRDDGRTQGEYAALWYNTDRFEPADSGNFWLSATPLVAGSIGWDAACVRIATWALLTDRTTGSQVLALNTHLDHVGPVARRLGAQLVLSMLDSISGHRDIPVVVTGDFNSGPADKVIIDITDRSKPLWLNDSRTTAPSVEGPEWTFHDFGRVEPAQRERIDYVFYRGPLRPLKYVTSQPADAAGMFLSDHCPVTVTFNLD